MANEIRTNLTVSVSNGSFKDNFQPGTIQMNQSTAAGGNPGTVNIGTSEEDVAFGDVTPGLIVMQNLDSTNFVKFGPKNGSNAMQLMGKISPGKIAYFELGSGVTLRMQADTAACNVLIKGYST